MIRRAIVINVLFFMAGFITITVEIFLHRLALLFILVALRMVWMQVKEKRAREEGARYGAEYGVRLYRQSAALHPESIFQITEDQHEVGR